MTGALAWAGVIGPGLFVVVFLVLGVAKPGYDATARFVSEGSIGELGWVQVANFVVLGVMLAAFAVPLWAGYGNDLSGRLGAALIAAMGVGLGLAGVFVTDPGSRVVSRHGLVHVIASIVVFASLTLACLTFAWRLRGDPAFAAYSVATGLFVPVGFVATVAAGRWLGIAQRVLIVVGWTWIAVLGWRLATA